MEDEIREDKETAITDSGDDLAEPMEDKSEDIEENPGSDSNATVNEAEADSDNPGTDGDSEDSEDTTATVVDSAIAATGDEDHSSGETVTGQSVLNGRKPSFNSLRQEHDMLLFARSLLLIVAAIALLIPIPFSYVGLKFVLFVFVSYAAIYNEINIGEEARMRKDKTSARAHGFAYVAFGAVTVLFFVLAIRAGVAASTMQDALQQCLEALKNAGMPAIIVK